MSDPLNIFEAIQNLHDEVDLSWSNPQFGNWLAHLNVLAWPISVQEEAGSPVYDYYLVQVEGQSMFTGGSDWSLMGYSIRMTAAMPTSDAIELVDDAPDTTAGATEYTSGITTTVSGSVGFMGDMPTASESVSVSMNDSSSRSIDDITISNLCHSGGMENAEWRFDIAAGSPSFTSNCPINVEALFRTPHGTDLSLAVEFEVNVTGGDPSEIVALDASKPTTTQGDELAAMSTVGIPGLIQLYKGIMLKAPPAPAGPPPAVTAD